MKEWISREAETVGLITYLRTDSTRVSDEADASVRDYIGKAYGEEFVAAGESRRGSGIEDYSRCSRGDPSDRCDANTGIGKAIPFPEISSACISWYGSVFLASRMKPARYETTSVKIAAGSYRFTVAASKIIFEGFRTVYAEAGEEKESEKGVLLKGLDMDSKLTKESFDSKQHFTQPPAHYTEAALVKTLEELGIGRPSTYAPTITSIIA